MRNLVLASVMSLLAACVSQVTDDQAVSLQPDQGIAAVVLNAPERIRQIAFEAKDPGGRDFEVADTVGGASLSLTPVKAGRYCLKHMRYGRILFQSKEDLACFTVVAGHITYAGEMLPLLPSDTSPNAGPGQIARYYDDDQFESLLKAQFGKLASVYPRAWPASPPAGVKPPDAGYALGTWLQQDDVHDLNDVYAQNNTAWDMTLKEFHLEGCVNVQQECGHHRVELHLAPFETKLLIRITPADRQQAYQYRWQLDDYGESR